MPSQIARQELPTTLRVVVTGGRAEEEKWPASPLVEDHHAGEAWSPTSDGIDDDRSAAIPTTAELEPLGDATATIQLAVQNLTTHEDWLQQHEAITVLRCAVVHHITLLSDAQILLLIPALVLASDNLRSALVKNALIALGECCAFLGIPRLQRFLLPENGSRHPGVPLVDVLLRRSTCEKRFLRDAACDTVDSLLLHLASPALIAAVAPYASSKNAKIVAVASKLMAHSLTQLHERGELDTDRYANTVYEALAKFRAGKESGARTESLASLRLLGEALGRARFETTLVQALPSQPRHIIASMIAEVFPPVAQSTPCATGRRGSLKDRMLKQQLKPSN